MQSNKTVKKNEVKVSSCRGRDFRDLSNDKVGCVAAALKRDESIGAVTVGKKPWYAI